jgi:hypothetical protein
MKSVFAAAALCFSSVAFAAPVKNMPAHALKAAIAQQVRTDYTNGYKGFVKVSLKGSAFTALYKSGSLIASGTVNRRTGKVTATAVGGDY